jgi:uncharacterized membrane protein YsdA (DUF1294 family)
VDRRRVADRRHRTTAFGLMGGAAGAIAGAIVGHHQEVDFER